MPARARTALLRLAVAAALLGGAAVATAAPEDVVADYNADGVIDEPHPPGDLLAALQDALESEAQYEPFADAVGVALDEALLGAQDSTVQPFAPPLVGGEQVQPLSPLPSPRPLGDGPPWVLLGMATMAGLLLVAGVASGAYRRLVGERNPPLRPAMRGSNVFLLHGGKAPQVKRAAARPIAQDEATVRVSASRWEARRPSRTCIRRR